ncbi:hypothetical protein BH10BAC1_BH10BAC1_00430 [soil metagenome]
MDIGRKFAVQQILKYFLLVISASLFLQIIGIDVSVIIASSAALLVGLGMGIQHLFSDFVSGFIVLLDGTIKVGDIIELEGMIAKVKKISLRTTTVETRDDKNIILPNSSLTNKNLINWTHSEVTSRFEISVGVDYSSDVNLVIDLIKKTALENSLILKNPEPFVRLVDFGDSSIKFQLFFWTNDVFRVEQIKSDIRVILLEAFTKHGVKIPFPQRVIHNNN